MQQDALITLDAQDCWHIADVAVAVADQPAWQHHRIGGNPKGLRLGIAGEYAFCRLVGMSDPAYIITPERYGDADKGIDFVAYGASVQVKARASRTGDLILPGNDYPPVAEVLTLCVAHRAGMLFKGWVDRQRFMGRAEQYSARKGRADWLYAAKDLLPMGTFIDACKWYGQENENPQNDNVAAMQGAG